MDQLTEQQSSPPTASPASNIPALTATLWRSARTCIARVPASAWMVLGLFLCAALVMAINPALAGQHANLRLKVQHNLRSADLSVWVDGDLKYSGKLVGVARKIFGLIPDVQGSMSETFPLSPGTKHIRVRIASDDGSVQEDTITSNFGRNAQQTLLVVAHRGDLSLNWQHSENPVGEPFSSVQVPSNSGWFDRYAGSLLMTIAGSIISALTGYAIKELPKITSRQANSPRA